MNTLSCLIKSFFLFFFFIEVGTIRIDNKGFEELISQFSSMSFANSKTKLVFMQIVKKKKRNYNRFEYIIKEFLTSTGVNCEMYNWVDTHYICITDISNYIDKELILGQFKGIISNIAERGAHEFRTDKMNVDL